MLFFKKIFILITYDSKEFLANSIYNFFQKKLNDEQKTIAKLN